MLYARFDGGGAVAPGPSASPTPAPTPSAGGPPAPGAAPTGPTTVSVAGSGYDPNYKDLITNDPAYLAANNAASAAAGTANAQRQARLRALYVQYGGQLPDSFKDQYGDIDQATRDAAAANQNSILARLKTSYDQGLQQFQKGLAARGALQSGEFNYGADQLNRGYGQQQYDAANQFTDSANEAVQNYLGVLQGNAGNLASAIGSAESSVFSNPAYRPVAPTKANYDTGLSAQYNQPVYKDDNGNMFDINGNPFAPPAASAAAAGGYDPYADRTNYYSPGFRLEP